MSKEPVKIAKLELENVKRVKAFKMSPSANGLTIIGGNNRQGKTSVLDAIAWALGGNKYRPSEPHRDGSVLPPTLHLKLSNGLVVERKGKNSDLKVIDPTNKIAGQKLLDTFVEEFALNLPKFMELSERDKAKTLLEIIGVGDQLFALEAKEQELYNKRHAIGQIADQKEKFAKEQPFHADAPKELVSASELIRQQQEILAINGENQRKRDNALALHAERNTLAQKVNALKEELERYQKQLVQVDQDMTIAYKTAEELHDESTAELEASIRNVEEVNAKVRQNLDKDKAEEDAKQYRQQYDELTIDITNVRQSKIDLLKDADLPLPELSVVDGSLTYKGQKWDNMSGAERLVVATSIVQKLNPHCGFVLLDKLEAMDPVELQSFGQWLEEQGLQAIATRVSTGEECSIVISDGYAVEDGYTPDPVVTETQPETNKWEAGKY